MKFLVSLLAFLFLATPVLAGGGPVALYAFPLRPFDQTKTYIVQSDIYTDEPCANLKPTFTFKENIAGDSITPFTPPNDGTYLTRHYNSGYPDFNWKEVCTTYVQAKSGSPIQRVVSVSVEVKGKLESRDTPLAFGNDAYSRQIQGFGRVNDHENTPHVDVLGDNYLDVSKRSVMLQWQKISWAEKYSVFAREVSQDGSGPGFSRLTTTQEEKATVTLSPSKTYYLSVLACRSNEVCDHLGESPYQMYLDIMRSRTSSSPIPVTPNITPVVSVTEPIVSLVPTNTVDEKKLDELNQKVKALENQLEQSNKKQLETESRLNMLINWLKSIFPFFGR